jgi:hypothetical protein
MAVEAQGGRIWLEPSAASQGTAACFTLPFA